jgi:hypothetical protein
MKKRTYGRLARTVTSSKGTSTIGRGTNDLSQGAQISETLSIAQGDKDDAMVSEVGEGCESCGLNTSVLRGSAHKDTSKLSVVGT